MFGLCKFLGSVFEKFLWCLGRVFFTTVVVFVGCGNFWCSVGSCSVMLSFCFVVVLSLVWW